MIAQALEGDMSPKKAAKSLKWLTKKAKKLKFNAAAINALKEAVAGDAPKKVRKAAKKLLKKAR